jgi:hypothetical protein
LKLEIGKRGDPGPAERGTIYRAPGCKARSVTPPHARSVGRMGARICGSGAEGLWVVGMLLAVWLKNYWIADEIYPYVC